ASTFLPPADSTRHTPTTETSALGSPPAASLAKSILSDCAATAGSARASASAAMTSAFVLSRCMTNLLYEQVAERRRAAAPAPRECDQQREHAEEPGEREVGARDQRVAGVIAAGRRRGWRNAGQSVEQRQDFPLAGGAAHIGSAGVDVI